MDRGNKKRVHYQKNDFSDEEIYQEIRDQIRDIRESNLKEVQKIQKIDELYREHKQSKKRKKMMERGNDKKPYSFDNKNGGIQSQSDQPGQINQTLPRPKQSKKNQEDISINQLGELIRPITLTRKRLIQFLDNRKFQDLVKGCFVRYKTDTSLKKQSYQTYLIAQIKGIKQGTKQYELASNLKTKILLVLQQSNLRNVDLPITMISNQINSGTIQIMNWKTQNRDQIPTQRQLKNKLQQHNRLLTEQLSSQQIDKNIQNRAFSMAKSDQEVRSYEDIQNLIDFIVEKIDNYQALEEQQISKRKQDKLQLIQIRRKKHQYQQVKKSLEEKKKLFLQKKGGKGKDPHNRHQGDKHKDRNLKSGNQAIKISQKRQDLIKQKSRLREMLLCTAEGYEKIKMNLLQNHAKYDFQIDF